MNNEQALYFFCPSKTHDFVIFLFAVKNNEQNWGKFFFSCLLLVIVNKDLRFGHEDA